jgi:hypothetical protein
MGANPNSFLGTKAKIPFSTDSTLNSDVSEPSAGARPKRLSF